MLDMVFVHPPASFRKHERPFSGVFPAEVGTDSFFRHAPLGLLSMAQRLRGDGFETRIVNLAKRLSVAARAGERVAIEEELAAWPARVYGIALHWAVHTPGALELAGIVRRVHPDSVIVMGGMTASIFPNELLATCPAVDAVVVGEGEEAVAALVRATHSTPFSGEGIPSLVYRDGDGCARTPATLSPAFTPDYFDTSLYVPGHEPDALVLPVLRGCIEDCSFCGGSRSAYRTRFGRPTVAGMSPEAIVATLRRAAEAGYPAAMLAGDIRGLGRRRAEELLDRLAAEELPLSLQNELFFMADEDYIVRWVRATRAGGLRLALSPECSDRAVRAQISHSKDYSNEAILDLARMCGDRGIRFLLCQLFALPGQGRDQILRDLAFAHDVVARAPTMAGAMHEPMLLIDPASRVFRDPASHGVRISAKDLTTIHDHLTRPYWTGALGYDTEWISRDVLIDTILDVSAGVARLHHENGQSSPSQYLFAARAVDAHRRVVEELRAAGALAADGESADAAVAEAVARHVPPAYLADNNLKDYVSHARAARGGEVAHAHFPLTVDVLLRLGVAPARAAETFERLGDAVRVALALGHRASFPGLPKPFADALAARGSEARPEMPGAMLRELATLELALAWSASAAHTLHAEALRGGVMAPPRGVRPSPETRSALAPGCAVLELTYPVHEVLRLGPEAVAAEAGHRVILVVAGRSHTYRAEAAELLLGLQRGPASPLEVLRSDPGPEGLADLKRFLERLWQTGAIVAAPG